MDFKLRPCVQDDYDWCYQISKQNMELYTQKHWNEWNPNFFTKNFKVQRSTIVEIEGKRVGFYEIECKKGLGLVHSIQIQDGFKGKGIGTKLMQIIEGNFKENKVNKSKLKVFIDNPALNLYERLGYKVIEGSKDYGSQGAVIMEKVYLS